MDRFQDIRPYNDAEVRPVLDSLMESRAMLDSIARFYAPRLSRWLPWLMRALARRTLRRQLRGVETVAAMQHVIASYMDKMIEDTTSSLTTSGLENLVPGRSYVFISNHRDIAMDPAFVNYMLYHAGFETLQIAIGDNLLKKPFVADLMRLNKSFIVKRSVKGRDLLAALRQLSEYIHHCIETDNNVWIAQREGRAKDGIDRTDPALLKMLAIAHRKLPLRESLGRLHIVPVTLSYQYDACDLLKAQELHAQSSGQGFAKDDDTDVRSIVTGMMGQKGAVHVAFGTELEIESDDPDRVAAQIDAQIRANYKVRDINFLALERLLALGALTENEAARASLQLAAWSAGAQGGAGEDATKGSPEDREARQAFERRYAGVEESLRVIWLRSYANALLVSAAGDSR